MAKPFKGVTDADRRRVVMFLKGYIEAGGRPSAKLAAQAMAAMCGKWISLAEAKRLTVLAMKKYGATKRKKRKK